MDIEKQADVFKALGETTRLEILHLLIVSGNKLCVGSISRQLGISQPSVSQHLKILKNAGIVIPVKEGVFIHYSIDLDFIKELSQVLIPFHNIKTGTRPHKGKIGSKKKK